MKLAVLVLGLESSGTKMLTKILIDNGFSGCADFNQPFDTKLEDHTLIVWRRSFPYGWRGSPADTTWPNLSDMIQQLKNKNYEIKVLVIQRDFIPMYKSQQFWHHVRTKKETIDNYQKGLPMIFEGIKQLPFYCVYYESLLKNASIILKEVFNWLGVERETIIHEIKDEDSKWFKKEEYIPVS